MGSFSFRDSTNQLVSSHFPLISQGYPQADQSKLKQNYFKGFDWFTSDYVT